MRPLKTYTTVPKWKGYICLFVYLELLEKLTAIPQNVLDLFNP